MYSSWKQTAYSVAGGIWKQRKLVLFYLIWIFLGSYWAVHNNIEIYNFYGIDLSTADLLLLLQDARYVGITVFPFATFLIMKCKMDSLNIQSVLRYGSRKRTFQKQILESAWYAIAVSLLLVGVQLLLSWMRTVMAVNWDAMSGLYYYKTGNLCKINIFWVIISVILMYLMKFLLVCICIDLLLWYPQFLFLIWVGLVLAIGIEIIMEIPVFYQIFSIQYQLWEQPFRHGINWGAGAVCAGMIYIAGSGWIRKKDILH